MVDIGFNTIVVCVIGGVVLVIKMVFITNGTNSIYVIVISVVGIAFQNVAQDVPETQSSVLIPIVLTGNRAVPITFA